MPAAKHTPHTFLTGALRPGPWPRSITPPGGGGKFTPEGRVLPFPGNTILFHIDPMSAAHAALIKVQDRAKAAPWASNFTFLPPSSFHMTLFEGVCMNAGYRGEWPTGIPTQATRDEVSGIFLDRLRDIRLPSRHVIRIDGIRHNAGIGLLASGADAGQESSLRHSRVVLREAMGITQPEFLQYRFHITLAYLLRWLDDDLAAQVGRDVRTFLKEFLETAEEIRLGPAEFCNFENMHEFRPLRLLDEPAV